MQTGEHRLYLPETGACGGISSARPLSFSIGGWGAWEVAARWNYVDLNSNATPAARGPPEAGYSEGGKPCTHLASIGIPSAKSA